ncbi:MAG: hypothetical protein K9G62_04065 [Alphaproteobacteria bacterium]|nr:hypothetical protein [Alphaproteobacteria bacterium]
MKSLTTSLLREKFIIPESGGTNEAPLTALSNRLALTLEGQEPLVIRAQNMHSCIRLAAEILEYKDTENFPENLKGNPLLKQIESEYERAYNHRRWLAVYHKGLPVWRDGDHHLLLDLIEKCAFKHPASYQEAITLAGTMLEKTGKTLEIAYEGNIALIIDYSPERAKNSIVLRQAGRNTTFSFSIFPINSLAPAGVPLSACLNAAAAFVEGIQLAFVVGANTEKMRRRGLPPESFMAKQIAAGQERLSFLEKEISGLEERFKITYRPEPPAFDQLTLQAEKLTARLLD